jgi:hypothetical protein
MKIEFQGPLAIVRSQMVTINLRNLLDLRISENYPEKVYALVRRKSERISSTCWDTEAELMISCAFNKEAEEVLEKLHEEHKKVCGCCWSSGIHEGPTVGYGELNESGYWQYGCNVCARMYERKHPKEGRVWPWAKETE